ncbi:MAG: alpha/beta hydrolase, partial [Thermoleophilia bacterium]|nr:alpha/beta hydrolase [Thermoleophilia bacterium]
MIAVDLPGFGESDKPLGAAYELGSVLAPRLCRRLHRAESPDGLAGAVQQVGRHPALALDLDLTAAAEKEV